MGRVLILDLHSSLLHADYQAVHISISHSSVSSVFQPDFHHGQDLMMSNTHQIFDIPHEYIHWLHVIILCVVPCTHLPPPAVCHCQKHKTILISHARVRYYLRVGYAWRCHNVDVAMLVCKVQALSRSRTQTRRGDV